MNRFTRDYVLKELFWLLSISSFSFFLCSLFLGLDFLAPGSTLIFEISGLYIQIPGLLSWASLFLFLAFLVYVVRSVRKQFWNLTANTLLILHGVALMALVAYLIQIFQQAPCESQEEQQLADLACMGLVILQCLLLGVLSFFVLKTLMRFKALR